MKGYWQDNYVTYFSKSAERKSPEISRGKPHHERIKHFPRELIAFLGYYARVTAYRMMVEKFIKRTSRACQVISLGAGFDTLFWHLHSKSLCPTLYMEVDFNSVVARKSHTIR